VCVRTLTVLWSSENLSNCWTSAQFVAERGSQFLMCLLGIAKIYVWSSRSRVAAVRLSLLQTSLNGILDFSSTGRPSSFN
jgi:hypothetical protein